MRFSFFLAYFSTSVSSLHTSSDFVFYFQLLGHPMSRERCDNGLPGDPSRDHLGLKQPSVLANCAPHQGYTLSLQYYSSNEHELLFAAPSLVFLVSWYKHAHNPPFFADTIATPVPWSYCALFLVQNEREKVRS